jgi:hypothetical protein
MFSEPRPNFPTRGEVIGYTDIAAGVCHENVGAWHIPGGDIEAKDRLHT